jgi:hypothetical protein
LPGRTEDNQESLRVAGILTHILTEAYQIYIYRERERERDRQTDRERERLIVIPNRQIFKTG